MKALIDGDILLHELGWSGEFKDKETGNFVLLEFEHVAELLDKKIELINQEVYATEKPTLFITNSEWIWGNRKRFINHVPEYRETFRYGLAKTKPYKGTRKNPKPFHFYNIISYLDHNYELCISADGYEADDEMCMVQWKGWENGEHETIICSRDKDLRICPGLHYSWECGKQRSIGPHYTDEFGSLEYTKQEKLVGYGLKFFYYQMLVGDSADNIPGLLGFGEKKAFQLLEECETEEDCFKLVKKLYIETVGKENAKELFLEQANLLWMVRERGKGYEIPNY